MGCFNTDPLPFPALQTSPRLSSSLTPFPCPRVALLQKVQANNKQAQDEAAANAPGATGSTGGRGTAFRRRQAAGDGGVQVIQRPHFGYFVFPV